MTTASATTAYNTRAKHCITEVIERLEEDSMLENVQATFFPAGDHAVSIPLKMRGRVRNHVHAYLAKLVTKDGVQAHREVITKKNTRFRQHGIYDIFYEDFDVPYDLLRHEALFLKAACAAGIPVPSFYDLYQLPTCAVLIMEFVQGTPFERSHFVKQDIVKLFTIIKQLRENQLIHGDLRRDNFLLTGNSDIYLIDYLHLKGSTQRALDYDLMSALCHLSLSTDPALVLDLARAFFPATAFKEGLPFLSFITERLSDQNRVLLERAISTLK